MTYPKTKLFEIYKTLSLATSGTDWEYCFLLIDIGYCNQDYTENFEILNLAEFRNRLSNLECKGTQIESKYHYVNNETLLSSDNLYMLTTIDKRFVKKTEVFLFSCLEECKDKLLTVYAKHYCNKLSFYSLDKLISNLGENNIPIPTYMENSYKTGIIEYLKELDEEILDDLKDISSRQKEINDIQEKKINITERAKELGIIIDLDSNQ